MKMLTEMLKCNCNSCGKNVVPDQNLACPSCGQILDSELLDFALANADNYVLIFMEDGSVNKANLLYLAKGHNPIGDTARVLPVNVDFFKLIPPDAHDRTNQNSLYGKIIPSKKSKEVQAILNMLRAHAREYREIKAGANFAEEFDNYANLWEAIKSPWPQEKYADFDKTLSTIAATYLLIYSFKNLSGISKITGLDYYYVMDLSYWSKFAAPKFNDMQAMFKLIIQDTELENCFKNLIEPYCDYSREKLVKIPGIIRQTIVTKGRPCSIRNAWSEMASANNLKRNKSLENI